MRHRLSRRVVALASILFLTALVLAGLKNGVSAQAITDSAARADEGALTAFDAQGRPAGGCPLKHTDVKAEITGFLARVTVTQEFANPFTDKIEAVYTFPLPQAAAVDNMTMVVGNRTIHGQIMRREEAQAAYQKAKTNGQVASLLDQERPNIFTQSVANIMPGEQVTVVISYVETLQYEAGTYEWSFPMVVGPRYIPGSADEPTTDASSTQAAQAESTPDNATSEQATATPSERVPDAARITPPAMPSGMRAGHDISIEVALDAGVPLDGVNSNTHEIEVERTDERSADVRLKEQATIPNKDFVLKYDVAGRKIEDALLTHSDGRGGFFTLILQPPERVTVADVTPKELVFVLDTSGSMEGFPLEKAKETMKLALAGLNPQDTFNLITFAGDTHILFSEPVPATPENLSKAQKFLASRKGDGGTEMMKAIRAALKPSDDAGHVRIVCFMTDGEVGDDMEIIGEVQKHREARVFAMGFSSAPNRFLLDKMAEYGRGEVEYVTEEKDDAGAAARRFYERVRDPLLTDISLDWGGLPVTDVYPKRIPDLFGAKPVILSGRYTNGASGRVLLKGQMSGHEFVRELQVELPAQEAQHDVLATLWARRKIDDLMGQDMTGMQTGQMRADLQKSITQLGLDYRLLTQLTSFVAIEEMITTDSSAPRRVAVPVEAPASAGGGDNTGVNNLALLPPNVTASGGGGGGTGGGLSETVTVTASAALVVDTTSAQLSTNVTARQVADLPLNGRNMQTLALLSPGATVGASGQAIMPAQTQTAVNGQRARSNSFVIDGVSANVGIAPGGTSPGATAAGNMPALTSAGGMNGLVTLDATQEVSVLTRAYNAEYGRATGAQVLVVTRSGTNEFHGSAFEYFGHDALDARDWFANSRGLQQPRRRQNLFGGTFGGPLQRNRLFFFGSYEGLRLRQPAVALTDVPSLTARSAAPANITSFFNAFPLPTGNARADGFAEAAVSYANPARHDAFSFRLDERINDRLVITGRYDYAASSATTHGGDLFSLNTLNARHDRTQTLTASAEYTLDAKTVAELRGNFSRAAARSAYRLDDFGGAIVPATTSFFAAPDVFSVFDLNGRDAALATGGESQSLQRQFQLLGAITTMRGTHTFKFGADYRHLFPVIGLRPFETNVLFNGVGAALTGRAARIGLYTHAPAQRPVFNDLSIYGQDEWRATPRLTLTYGVRWELNLAPAAADGRDAFAVTQTDELTQLALAPRGSRLWHTTYGNFAPRVGVAYQLSNASGRELVLRGGFAVVYDTAHDEAGQAYGDSFPFLAGQTLFNAPFTGSLPTAFPSLDLTTPVPVPFVAFDPKLKLPYTLQWNLTAERALGSAQALSLAYVGASGRRLLRAQTFFDPNPDFAFVRLVTNGATSNYQALQLQFNRRLRRSLQASASYTWGQTIDDAAQDAVAHTLLRNSDPRVERAASDFDVRHTLTGLVSYKLPTLHVARLSPALWRNWTLDAIFNARSARPVNVVYAVPTSFGFAYLRPDTSAGVPLYLFEPTAAGGRRINPAAFIVPDTQRQGTLGRNSLRGFPFTQVDFALGREFKLTEGLRLQLKAEAFNLFNQVNFADPVGMDVSLGSRLSATGPFVANETFGQSASVYGRSLSNSAGGSFGSFYGFGGPRTLRLSLRLRF